MYVEALERHVVGRVLERARLASVSLLRSVEPPLAAAEGRRVLGASRLGKRIVLSLEGELYLVFHLMIAGRLRWKKRGAAIPAKRAHAAFDFANGTLAPHRGEHRRSAPRSTWCRAPRASPPTTRAASRCWSADLAGVPARPSPARATR